MVELPGGKLLKGHHSHLIVEGTEAHWEGAFRRVGHELVVEL